jgi:hypothetical protein
MTNTNSSFIDAAEQRAQKLSLTYRNDSIDWFECYRQALTEVLAEAGPVAWIHRHPDSGNVPFLSLCEPEFMSNEGGTSEPLFTAPPADNRDARIAELEADNAELKRFAHVGKEMVNLTTTVWYENEWPAIPALWAECAKERDELRAKLAAAQAALISARWMIGHPDNVAIVDRAIAAIATDQSAAGSEAT